MLVFRWCKLMIVGWHPATPVDKVWVKEVAVTSGFASRIQACELKNEVCEKVVCGNFMCIFTPFYTSPKIWLFFSRWSSNIWHITPKQKILSWKVGILKSKRVGFRGHPSDPKTRPAPVVSQPAVVLPCSGRERRNIPCILRLERGNPGMGRVKGYVFVGMKYWAIGRVRTWRDFFES